MLINYNITGYLIYLSITTFITLYVGWMFYSNGEVYLRNIFRDEPEFVRPINRILLAGYYLLNLGYAASTLSSWGTILSIAALLDMLAIRLGFIMIALGIIHYFNMIAVNIIHFIVHNRHLNQKN